MAARHGLKHFSRVSRQKKKKQHPTINTIKNYPNDPKESKKTSSMTERKSSAMRGILFTVSVLTSSFPSTPPLLSSCSASTLLFVKGYMIAHSISELKCNAT